MGEEPNKGASGEGQPVFEAKDGVMTVDGKKVVFESDLIAAKKSLEGDVRTATGERDNANLELSKVRGNVASLTAELEDAKKALKEGATSEEEVSRIKQELEDAKSKVESLTTNEAKALEYRRAYMVAQYGIAADTIKEKTMAELDSMEDAFKALGVTGKGGVGSYAVGGSGTGSKVLTNSPYQNATEAYSRGRQ